MFYQKVEMQCVRKGISVTKLTKILGLSSSVITGWKNGATPRLSTVKMIADFFRVSPDTLLDGNEAHTPASVIPEAYGQLTDEERQLVNQLMELMVKNRDTEPSVD